MSRWFRYYEDALNDPKVQLLSDSLFRAWVNLLCVASQNGGELPSLGAVAFALRLPESKAAVVITTLARAVLLDAIEGRYFAPHNWGERQYIGDSSTSRVKKYRDNRKAAGLPALSDYSKFKPSLLARDGDGCVYCEAKGIKLVVDHMVPISLGGSDDEDNLALACKPCNSGKAGRTPELANMTVRVTTAAKSLERYRDKKRDVTVTETAPDYRADTDSGRETRVREEPTVAVSKEAIELSRDFLTAIGVKPEDPELAGMCGAPYSAAMWLSRGYDRPLILATAAKIYGRYGPGKSLSYYSKCIETAQSERTAEPKPGEPRGADRQSPPQRNPIQAALDGHLARFEREARGDDEAGPPAPRLLSHG